MRGGEARARIEATVEARLDEAVEMPADARVEEEREARVHEAGVAGRALVDVVALEIEETAQIGAHEAPGRLERARPVEAVEPRGLGARRGGDGQQREHGERPHDAAGSGPTARSRYATTGALNPLSASGGTASTPTSAPSRRWVASSISTSI